MSVRTPRTKRTNSVRTATIASPVVISHVGDPKPELETALAKLRELVANTRAGDKPVIQPSPAKLVAHEERVCDALDFGLIEAEHYGRDAACQPLSPAQSPLNQGNGGVSNVEHYAPKTVTVLALPVLMCLGCTLDKPCTHETVIKNTGMGACASCLDNGLVRNPEKFVPVARTSTTATQDYTGKITRS